MFPVPKVQPTQAAPWPHPALCYSTSLPPYKARPWAMAFETLWLGQWSFPSYSEFSPKSFKSLDHFLVGFPQFKKPPFGWSYSFECAVFSHLVNLVSCLHMLAHANAGASGLSDCLSSSFAYFGLMVIMCIYIYMYIYIILYNYVYIYI